MIILLVKDNSKTLLEMSGYAIRKKTAPILCRWGCSILMNVGEDPAHAFGCNKVTKQVEWRHNDLRETH
jgi:hypothetical protein